MSKQGRLIIFLEGADDERFFKAVFEQKLLEKYERIQYFPYARESRVKINEFMSSILKTAGDDYLFFADIDQEPCVTEKKSKLRGKYSQLQDHLIFVVKKEIESWYLAGISQEAADELKIRGKLGETDTLTKEQFDQKQPTSFTSRIDFLQEILKIYSLEVALPRNQSLAYFHGRYFASNRAEIIHV
jgi:hypothetical protein